jgi:hypothetical protein
MVRLFGLSLAALLSSLILAKVCDWIKPNRERRPILWESPEQQASDPLPLADGIMLKRKLRIARRDLATVIGVCEHCNTQFCAESEPTVEFAFDAHECRLTDSSENALRIVSRATKGK